MKNNLHILLIMLVFASSFNARANGKNECDECIQTKRQYLDSLITENLANQSEFEKLRIQLQQSRDSIQSLQMEESLHFFYVPDSVTKFSNRASWPSYIFFIALITIFLFIALISAWSKVGFDIKEALAETKVIEVSEKDAGAFHNIKKEVKLTSSSRLLALISGIVAICLSITLIVLTFYIYLHTGSMPDYSSMVNAVIALGIGVVPYTINKIAGSFK